MTTLHTIVGRDPSRQVFIQDCVRLITQTVQAQAGLSGMAIKGSYAAVLKLRPRFLDGALAYLLDDFIQCLEPFYAEAMAQAPRAPLHPSWLSTYFTNHQAAITEAMLRITDDHAQRSSHGPLKSIYMRLRPIGKSCVQSVIPELGLVLQRYCDGAHPCVVPGSENAMPPSRGRGTTPAATPS